MNRLKKGARVAAGESDAIPEFEHALTQRDESAPSDCPAPGQGRSP